MHIQFIYFLIILFFQIITLPIIQAAPTHKNENLEAISAEKITHSPNPSKTDISAAAIAQEVILQAMSLIGVRYKWGGNNPDTGLDCSGFIRYVFQQSTNLVLPRSAHGISQMGKIVSKTELQPGDLVFFNTLHRRFSHVGIYLGDNRFIHSPSKGKAVTIARLSQAYWTERYNGARRLKYNFQGVIQDYMRQDARLQKADTNLLLQSGGENINPYTLTKPKPIRHKKAVIRNVSKKTKAIQKMTVRKTVSGLKKQKNSINKTPGKAPIKRAASASPTKITKNKRAKKRVAA